MPWLFLAVAIACEIAGTLGLRAVADDLTWWAIGLVVVAYAASFAAMARGVVGLVVIVVGVVVADVADDGDGGDTAVGAGVPPPQASDRDHLDSAIIVS